MVGEHSYQCIRGEDCWTSNLLARVLLVSASSEADEEYMIAGLARYSSPEQAYTCDRWHTGASPAIFASYLPAICKRRLMVLRRMI